SLAGRIRGSQNLARDGPRDDWHTIVVTARERRSGHDLYVAGEAHEVRPRRQETLAEARIAEDDAIAEEEAMKVRGEIVRRSALSSRQRSEPREALVDTVEDLLPPDSIDGYEDDRVDGAARGRRRCALRDRLVVRRRCPSMVVGAGR